MKPDSHPDTNAAAETSPNTTPDATDAAASPPAGTGPWIIVTQVKSHRVVYFTDDPSYQPAMDGDWYYCSPYPGTLPAEMTLRNCWGWRFDGHRLIDARSTPGQGAGGHDSLLQSNRKALLALLHEKINSVREPFLPSCSQGDAIRQLKLREAQAYLALTPSPTSSSSSSEPTRAVAPQAFAHLHAVATARGCSLLQAAQLVLAKAQETQRVLLDSERFRETLSQAIAQAQTQPQLLQIRSWLLDQVYPELSREFKFRIENTEPLDLQKALPETQRQHEIARLKAQLREAINAQREPLHSRYVQNDEVRKQKARQAQAVLAHGTARPQDQDITLLRAYAQARQLDLPAAAELLVQSMASAAELLTRTETTKDQLLARIEAIATLADVQAIDAELRELQTSAGR